MRDVPEKTQDTKKTPLTLPSDKHLWRAAPLRFGDAGNASGREGMGYALMMSARNAALFGADVVGSWVLDRFPHFPWNGLVTLNAATTLVCLLLVPFLPKILTRHKDGENFGDSGSPTSEQVSAVEPGK